MKIPSRKPSFNNGTLDKTVMYDLNGRRIHSNRSLRSDDRLPESMYLKIGYDRDGVIIKCQKIVAGLTDK